MTLSAVPCVFCNGSRSTHWLRKRVTGWEAPSIRRAALCALLGGVSMLSACRSPAETAQIEILLQADRDFATMADKQGAAAAFAAYCADDAIELPSEAPPLSGAQSIAAEKRVLGSNKLSWTPRGAQVSRDGSMGWTWGEWRIMPPNETTMPLQRGKYLDVWRHEADGSWKVVADIGNLAN